jgi:Putative excisionase (DUF1233)
MELDLISGSEVRQLLGGISVKTLQRYRLKYWTEGVHYLKPVQLCRYNRPLIHDWILNHSHDPVRHQQAIEDWVKSQQGTKRGRKSA